VARRDLRLKRFARDMRRTPTKGEEEMWKCLRRRRLGVRFRRQEQIGPYIVDFACLSHGIVVEIDGPRHAGRHRSEIDRARDIELRRRGFRILRIGAESASERADVNADWIWCVIHEQPEPPDIRNQAWAETVWEDTPLGREEMARRLKERW